MIDLEIEKQDVLNQIDCLQQKLEDIQKQIDAQSKIEPVFSGDFGIYTHNDEIDANYNLWQKARARIIEKINIANKGDNGFKAGKYNYKICLEYDHENKNPKFSSCGNTRAQDAEPMFYIRTYGSAQELLRDPEFCGDMKTYFKGWL